MCSSNKNYQHHNLDNCRKPYSKNCFGMYCRVRNCQTCNYLDADNTQRIDYGNLYYVLVHRNLPPYHHFPLP